MNGIKSEEEPALRDRPFMAPQTGFLDFARMWLGPQEKSPSQCFSVFLGHTGALQTGRDSGRISPVFLKPAA